MAIDSSNIASPLAKSPSWIVILPEAVQGHGARQRIGLHGEDLLEGCPRASSSRRCDGGRARRDSAGDRIAGIAPPRRLVGALGVGDAQLVLGPQAGGEVLLDRLAGGGAPVGRREVEAELVRHGHAELLERLGGFLGRFLGEAVQLQDLGVEGDGAVLVARLLALLGGVELIVGGLLLALHAVLHHVLDLREADEPPIVPSGPPQLGAVRGQHQHRLRGGRPSPCTCRAARRCRAGPPLSPRSAPAARVSWREFSSSEKLCSCAEVGNQ